MTVILPGDKGVSRYESVVLADIFKIMGVNPSLNMPAEIRIIS
jgi:hypothetical protein